VSDARLGARQFVKGQESLVDKPVGDFDDKVFGIIADGAVRIHRSGRGKMKRVQGSRFRVQGSGFGRQPSAGRGGGLGAFGFFGLVGAFLLIERSASLLGLLCGGFGGLLLLCGGARLGARF
jgi:hypothetical protein